MHPATLVAKDKKNGALQATSLVSTLFHFHIISFVNLIFSFVNFNTFPFYFDTFPAFSLKHEKIHSHYIYGALVVDMVEICHLNNLYKRMPTIETNI